MDSTTRPAQSGQRARLLLYLLGIAVALSLALIWLYGRGGGEASSRAASSASTNATVDEGRGAEPAQLTVRTVSAGKPLPGASVLLERDGTRSLSRVERSGTDGLSTFDELPPGDYRITAAHASHGSATVQRRLNPGARDKLTLNLAPTRDEGKKDATVTARLSGRVLDPQGMPVASAQVGASAGSAPPRFASTREDGRFDLDSLSGGSVNVFATAAGFAPTHQRDVQVGNQDLTLVLQPPARITGRLEYAARPQALYVRLCHHDPDFDREICIKSSYYEPPADSFELDRLPSGDYDLVVAANDRELTRVPVTIRAGDDLDVGSLTLP